jgi:hypothetical protein
MGCQREEPAGQAAQGGPATPARKLRLTDQALVAVTIARHAAAQRDQVPSCADLVVGLATETEGWAGHLLRAGGQGPVIALAGRAGSAPAALATLGDVLLAAAQRARPRPPGTADLLVSALRTGGHDLADLLDSCGFPALDLPPVEWRLRGASWYIDAEEDWGATAETVTLAGPDHPRLDAAAARVVGRVRAIAGGAVDLLTALDLDPAVDLAPWTGTDRSDIVLARLQTDRDDPSSGSAGWDLGLEPVLEAAQVLAGPEPVSVGPLLQATLIAGGAGPPAILDAARATGSPDPPDSDQERS